MKNIKVGIESIDLYIPKYYIDINKLEDRRNIDSGKWTIGIGQETMAIVPKTQDIVSMAANAAYKIIKDDDKNLIDQIIFATETGLDYSKASATYIQELLEINNFVRSYEIKQACYSTTAALQIACDYVRLNPERKVLVLSSDISKYGKDSSGEVTQGAGAIAILISNNPEILEITNEKIFNTSNKFDFWRPNNYEYPLVDGKYSIDIYNDSFKTSFYEFENRYNNLNEIKSIIFHLPFKKMQKKALYSLDEKYLPYIKNWEKFFDNSSYLCTKMGNLYTGSLYLSLISLLYYDNLEPNSKIALFSYGSGAVGEMFTGIISENYKEKINNLNLENRLSNRKEINLDLYDKFYFTNELDVVDSSIFKLDSIIDEKRVYKKF